MKKLTYLIFILLLLFTHSASAEIKLRFGIYTSDKPSSMVKQFRPVLNALEKKMTDELGEAVEISLQVAKSYNQGIEDLVTGHVDFSRMGPSSFITSKLRNPDLQLLAMESNKGKKTFNGIICVHQDSPIQRISDLKGKSFAFGDKLSTIGRYLSQFHLLKNNIHAKDLSSFEYLFRHDRVGTVVGSGRYDAGALKESTFKKLKDSGVKIRKLADFPNVTKPWIASSQLNGRLTKALKASLMGFNDKLALEKLKKAGFLPATDDDYATIKESMLRNDEFFR